jgi:carbon-monoxide dehydrogenase small subunit
VNTLQVKTLSLAINGRRVEAEVEPRTHLADFLRGQQFLTGTHIGCEHGVCGACTVLIDGAPARSCITFAVGCEGAAITTIEGLADDPVTGRLREAFSANHALQCGYCTPGMLISCRDIVTRLPEADEACIRLELSGNLCRCTGYMGIVAAVKQVLASGDLVAHRAPARTALGPVGSHAPAAGQGRQQAVRQTRTARTTSPSRPVAALAVDWKAVEAEGVELLQSFRVAFPRDHVWRFFGDLQQVARCMPGARLTSAPQNGRAEGEVNVKLGPIVSAFAGAVEVERDDANYRGIVRGAGRDAKSASNARALISYTLAAVGEAATQVDISVKFVLSGALAQFSRSGLVKDVADHLTRAFTRNLETALSGAPIAAGDQVLDAGAVARAAFLGRFMAALRRIFRSA